MFTAKYFHEPGRKISDLSEILWVDIKTIQNDLKKLEGRDNDPLQVNGEVFKIPEIDKINDTLIFESTAHPLFLTPNITQLIVMLKGLKEMSENPMYGNSAKIIAENIWAQLSDYAKTRIPEVLMELLSEDPAWYKKLETADKNLWHTERACSVDSNIFFYSQKDRRPFFMEVRDGDKKVIYKKCRTIHYDPSGIITISSDGKEMTISIENVVQIAHTTDGIH